MTAVAKRIRITFSIPVLSAYAAYGCFIQPDFNHASQRESRKAAKSIGLLGNMVNAGGGGLPHTGRIAWGRNRFYLLCGGLGGFEMPTVVSTGIVTRPLALAGLAAGMVVVGALA